VAGENGRCAKEIAGDESVKTDWSDGLLE